MKLRKHEAEHTNHDRWLVSYADFITLLFAFFVVMFASSQTDRRKAGESVRRAFSTDSVTAKIYKVLGGTVDDVGQGNKMMRGPGGRNEDVPVPKLDTAELLPSSEFLNRELAEDILAKRLSIHMEARGLVVSLREAAYFVSGDATASASVYPVLDKIAEAIRQVPNAIRLEGHTDSIPIHNTRFRNNWELSAGRGIAMLELLQTRYGIDPARMAATGYADSSPVADNDSTDGRAKNRRVDIVILNQSGMLALPDSIAKPGASPDGSNRANLPGTPQPVATSPGSPGATPSR